MAVKAISERLGQLHRYPDGSGFYLKEQLSEKFSVPIEQIILGNGSNEVIELVVRTFLSPGEHVIQPFPTFLVYEKVVKSAGGVLTSFHQASKPCWGLSSMSRIPMGMALPSLSALDWITALRRIRSSAPAFWIYRRSAQSFVHRVAQIEH